MTVATKALESAKLYISVQRVHEVGMSGIGFGVENRLIADINNGLAQHILAMKALQQIKADPSGYPMCDSGKLRDPDKAHWDTCGYLLMEMMLTCAD